MSRLPSLETVDARVAIARRCADAAAEVTRAAFRADIAIDNKACDGFDPVTEADRAAERAIRAVLAREVPEDGVIGEEYDPVEGQSGWTWTLDPIDGTRSFITGIPLWTTLIAASYENEPLIGLIDQPVLQERYLGTPGGTVFLQGSVHRPIRVRHCAALTDAVLMATTREMFDPTEDAAFAQVSAAARLTRFGADAYAYARLAAGGVDMVVESGLQTYDVAALIPVVRGAGGVVTDWRGRKEVRAGQVIAAANGDIAAEARVALGRSAR